MTPRRTLPALILVAAAGVVASLFLAGTAAAYTIDQLPGLGYSVSVTHLADGCSTWAAGYGHAAQTDLGNDCDADFGARVDAFVEATCPCAQTTTTASPTVTAGTDTTTTVASPSPPPASTDPAATTTTVSACDVQCQIVGLQAQIDSIRSELVQLVQILEQWPAIDPGILAQLMSLPG